MGAHKAGDLTSYSPLHFWQGGTPPPNTITNSFAVSYHGSQNGLGELAMQTCSIIIIIIMDRCALLLLNVFGFIYRFQ